MDERRIYIDQADEAEANEERNKKILAILLILLVFSGVYYYFTLKKPQVSQTSVTVEPMVDNTSIAKNKSVSELKTDKNSLAKVISPEIKDKLKEKAAEVDKKLSFSSGKIILPTQKKNIISFAVSVGGKSDPFYDKNADSTEVEASDNKKLKIPPSVSPAGLPFITGVPSNFSGNLFAPYVDKIELKGFIGNKAILAYEDDIQTLKAKNSFHGAVILSVNPYSYCVKLKKGNKIYTKRIKDLAEPSYTESASSLPKLSM
ncbi:MAG: hypothetical protein WCK67_10805 [bacterium]